MYYEKYLPNKITFVPGHKSKICKYLVIVESPSKVKAIGNFLGNNYEIIASNGHICNIKGLKDIDMKTFETHYSMVESNKKTIDYMRSVIELYDTENIFIATDGDVEGEKIGYDICNIFGLQLENTKRVIFNEITEAVIKEAILNPKLIDINIVKSQQARQIVDILIGYKISPLLSKYISPLLSCGRCQTVALKLIYDKEKEKNSPELIYETVGHFFNHPYTIALELYYKFVTLTDMKSFMKQSMTFNHEFSMSEKYISSELPPTPFNTSKLLQESCFSPKLTMQLAQQLYIDGKITYIRTESMKYSKDFVNKMNSFIINKFKTDEYIGDSDSISNDCNNLSPHEAIRVTDINEIFIKGEKDLVALYNIIYKNSIESCMSAAKYNNYDITVTSPIKSIFYKKTIRNSIFLGWKTFTKISKDIDNYDISFLKYLKKNIKYQYIESNIIDNSKKSHYTQYELLKKMEKLSIGRPSTILSYGEIILERGYVKLLTLDGITEKCLNLKLSNNEIMIKEVVKQFGKEKNVYVIQETGRLCIDFLFKYFQDIFCYSYTRKIEDRLDLIKINNTYWSEVCEETNKDINVLVKRIKNDFDNNKIIDDTHEIMITKQGPMIKHKIDKGFEILPIALGIDLDKLYDKEYSLKDIVQFENSFLGNYQDKSLELKVGKFGPFFSWNEKNFCIKDINIELANITLEDAISFIENGSLMCSSRKKMDCESKTILRVIDTNTSIRRGYYGDYIYHKTPLMKKPKFVSLKNINENFISCDASIIYKLIKNI